MKLVMNYLLALLILGLAVLLGRMAHAETLSNHYHVPETGTMTCSCERILYLDTWMQVLFAALFPQPPGYEFLTLHNSQTRRIVLQILEGRFQGNYLTDGIGFYTPVTMDNGMQ